jgi:hypothetical protein
MARLPQPGSDSGTWGDILNDYLSQALKPDGTIKDNAVTANALAPNSVTNDAIVPDAVNATSIANGSISEALLDSAVQAKLNATAGTPDWNTITNKPAVIAAGADQAAARAVIGAGTSNLAIGTSSTTAKAGDYVPTKAEVGLGNVDNTSDAGKPVSTATQTALNAKAPLASPTFTGTVVTPALQVTGGTLVSGKVLTSDSSGNATWQTPVSGFADPTTTKGDLIVRGTTTTRQPIGSDGQVLTADSTQVTGVKWASGGSSNPGYATYVGDGTSGPFTITHSLGSRDVIVTVYKSSTLEEIMVRADRTTSNTVVLRPDETWTTNQYRVVVSFAAQSDITAPTAPTLSVDSHGTNHIQVSATGATDAVGITGYNWYRNGVKINSSPTASNSYDHTGLAGGTSYAFNATALDLAGNESAQSNTVNQSTDAASLVARSALGTGGRVTTGNTVNWAHTVPAGSNRMMLVGVVDSHGTAFFGNTYDTYTVTSDLDGALTQLSYQDIGQFTSSKIGTVRMFTIMNPTVGTHNISVNVVKAGQTFTQIMGNSASYTGVGSLGTPIGNTTTATGALSLTVPSATGNMVAAVHVFGASAPVGYNKTTLYSAGVNVSGDGDYIIIGEAAGAASVGFSTTSTAHRTASVGVDLRVT